jgi:hypothetical protein
MRTFVAFNSASKPVWAELCVRVAAEFQLVSEYGCDRGNDGFREWARIHCALLAGNCTQWVGAFTHGWGLCGLSPFA